VLEDALVDAMGEVGQLWHQREPIAGQALARFTLGDAVDQPVDAPAGGVEGKKGGFMQQCLQIQIGVLADQLEVEAIRLADGFPTTEGEDLQIVLHAFERQAEVGFIGRVEHGLSLF